MKKRYWLIVLIVIGIIMLGVLHSLAGSNAVTRSDGFLISAKCTLTGCTFLFKGSDTLSYAILNNAQYSANYVFHRSGNWTVSMNNYPSETINYLLELTHAQAIEGVVRVQ